MQQYIREGRLYTSGGSRGVSRFPQKPPFEIDFNPVSLSTLIEQSDRDSLIEQSDRKCYVLLEIIAVCEKKDCSERSVKVDNLFFFNSNLAGFFFCQAETETPFQKSWIRHCIHYGTVY